MPTQDEMFDVEQQFIIGMSRSSKRSRLVLTRGRGSYLWDIDGKRYLDFTAGVGIMSTGHCHPKVVAAVQHQTAELIGWHDASTSARVELLLLLAKHLPERLHHFAMFSSGAETVEAAVRFCRAFTGRLEVVSFWGSFHGKTRGALSLTGHNTKRQWPHSVAAGDLSIPYANCFACPLSLSWPTCEVACARFACKAIEACTVAKPAAVILEPMQGTQGNIIPPVEFVQRISRWCKTYSVPLIVDEILTGCGRTGKLFAFEHYGIEPDVLLLGKGLGSGFPVGVVAMATDIALHEHVNRFSAASSSFGGNPVSAAAARATLETIIEDALVQNAARVGKYMLERFLELKTRHPLIRAVRGQGLLIGVDLAGVAAPLPPAEAISDQVVASAIRRGLLLMASGATLRVNPPLILSRDEAEVGIGILDEVLSDLEEQMCESV